MSKLKKIQKTYDLPVNNIVVDFATNVRLGEDAYEGEDFEMLEASIKESGLHYPITVQQVKGSDDYRVVHGFRRTKAVLNLIANGADITHVPVNITRANDEQILLDHVTKNSGKPLTALELSTIFVKLRNYGYEIKEIATKTGHNYQKVRDLLAFDENATKRVKDAVKNGDITITAAREFSSGSFKSIDEQNEKFTELAKKTEGKIKVKDVKPAKKVFVPTELEMSETDKDRLLIAIEETFDIVVSDEQLKTLTDKIKEYGVRF